MKLTHSALLALATTAMASPVALADPAGQTAATVSIADLDLTARSDAEVLLHRIEAASKDVCANWRSIIPRGERHCQELSVKATVDTLDIDALNAAYRTAERR